MTDPLRPLLDSLIPGEVCDIATRFGTASRALQDFRNEAGPKARWSAHQRLHEARLFNALCEAAEEISCLARRFLPAHWEMQDWALRVRRGGDQMRWAGKGGAATGGHVLGTGAPEVALFLGLIAGVAAGARILPKADGARLARLGLDPETPRPYALPEHSRPGSHFIEGEGKTPRDARARLIATGKLFSHFRHSEALRVSDPQQSFCVGVRAGAEEAGKTFGWSAGPVLWPALFLRRRAVRRLVSEPGHLYSRANPPWAHMDAERLDDMLVRALRLADSLDPPPRKLAVFLVNDGEDIWHTRPGWCGSSALLGHLLEYLLDRRLPETIEDWQVFAMRSECGMQARSILAPRHPPSRKAEAK